MIKVIIFDADGVLNHGTRPSIALERDYGIPLDKTLNFFNGPFQECRVGKADLKEVVAPYLLEWGWTKGVDAFLDYWFTGHYDVDQDVIEYIQGLRHKGVLCVLGTNQEKYRFQYMSQKIGYKNIFDKVYASFELDYVKPDREFFDKIFKDFPKITKEEMLLVDDRKENIQAAKKFGMHAEFYISLTDLREKMKQYS